MHRRTQGHGWRCSQTAIPVWAVLLLAASGHSVPWDLIQSEGVVPPSASTIPPEFRPEGLLGRHAGPVPEPTDGDLLRFHWVITTCPSRRNWGRYISSTLLSGLANDLRPASISLVMCEHYNATQRLPALLHNLRYSHSVHVWFPSASYPITRTGSKGAKQRFWRTTLTTLLVPAMLNAVDLPLLMTEDDVVFAPDAGARISRLVRAAKARMDQPDDMYYITLYNHGKQMQVPPGTVALPQVNVTDSDAHTSLSMRAKRGITWGFQGVLMSPRMTDTLRQYFQNIAINVTDEATFAGHSDWRVSLLLRGALRCNARGSGCHAFIGVPGEGGSSIVQHIGTMSSTFMRQQQDGGQLNHNFHMAHDTVEVAFPGFEGDALWRRRRRHQQ